MGVARSVSDAAKATSVGQANSVGLMGDIGASRLSGSGVGPQGKVSVVSMKTGPSGHMTVSPSVSLLSSAASNAKKRGKGKETPLDAE